MTHRIRSGTPPNSGFSRPSVIRASGTNGRPSIKNPTQTILAPRTHRPGKAALGLASDVASPLVPSGEKLNRKEVPPNRLCPWFRPAVGECKVRLHTTCGFGRTYAPQGAKCVHTTDMGGIPGFGLVVLSGSKPDRIRRRAKRTRAAASVRVARPFGRPRRVAGGRWARTKLASRLWSRSLPQCRACGSRGPCHRQLAGRNRYTTDAVTRLAAGDGARELDHQIRAFVAASVAAPPSPWSSEPLAKH